MTDTFPHHPASYRDPSGFVFEIDGLLYRQVNQSFKEHFDHFIQSGCYDHLVKNGWLIPHQSVPQDFWGDHRFYATIRPERVAFISYPYEWCFDMLKDAALLTLRILRAALDFGLILKDASPGNVQWHEGKLVFIDTLSFEKYQERPWIAYRQFCEQFLAPLLLMHYSRKHMPNLLLAWPEGIPLPIASSLLPRRSRFSLYAYLHLHLHARYSLKPVVAGDAEGRHLPKKKLINLIGSLEALLQRLKAPREKTNWSDYYEEANRRPDYITAKKNLIQSWVNGLTAVETVTDLGANRGEFAKLVAENRRVIACDFDGQPVNDLYNEIKASGEKRIQPLILDLSNPSPATGVGNRERNSFIDRSDADLVMALALLHHLAIGKNIPFHLIAATLSRLGKKLIIEFVPKEDEKVRLMLAQKKDIYDDYHREAFEQAFLEHYTILREQTIAGSERVLYLMERHEGKAGHTT